MTIPWSCDPWLPYLTGGMVGVILGFFTGWALGRWNRRGGKVYFQRVFDHSQIEEDR